MATRSAGVAAGPPSKNTRFRVLVLDAASTFMTELNRCPSGEGLSGATVVCAPDLKSSPAWADADVVVIVLRPDDFAALSWATQLAALNSDAELLFYAPRPENPVCLAAKSLGITRILAGPRGLAWLGRHASALASVAACRRSLRQAREGVPAGPWEEEASDGIRPAATRAGSAEHALDLRMPLRLAETHFREAYLRGILARATDRRDAARLAGVPYRTLCAMMQRFELHFDDDEEDEDDKGTGAREERRRDPRRPVGAG